MRALQGKTKPSRRENLSDLDCLSGDWIDMTGIRKSQGHQIPIVILKFNFPVPGNRTRDSQGELFSLRDSEFLKFE